MKPTKSLPLLLALTLTVHAQTNAPLAIIVPAVTNPPAAVFDGPRSLSLEVCVRFALEKNLDLRIERYNPQLSVFNLSIAYAGYDPVFAASGSREHDRVRNQINSGYGLTIPPAAGDLNSVEASLGGSLPWGMSYNLQSKFSESDGHAWAFTTNPVPGFLRTPTDESSGSASITLTQPLLRDLWMDNNRLNVAVAKNQVKYSEQSLRLQLISTVSAVETAYYELIFAQDYVKVQEKALQLAEQLFRENKKRVEVGVLAPLDEKQAESQMATRRADLLAAQRTLESRQNTLKSLITDDYAAWHDLVLQPAETLGAVKQFFNVRDSWSRGLNDRPDLLQSKLDLEQAGIQLKYYRNQLFPQLDLFGTYGRAGDGVELNDTLSDIRRDNRPYYAYGLQFSIPLGNVAARTHYKKSKVTVEQAVLALKKFEQTVMVQIDEAIKQAQSSYERVQATREASAFAQAALEAEQKKLENGKSTSFNVLSLQSDLTAARSSEIRALADYNEALTALAQAEGSTLEHRRIDVKVK
jgi:outer membrane protein TolC